ncbi:MAG: M20/M25/M40 family metallo-hydrolase [Sphingobacteriales bacterium]|nr:M20/M25/M40 family metallo-hydrolase [Sphingobacteriales bacterium]MBI3718961.1 M20/M25/M40 family metallo-hydrolase [Sphingobacteriales bacterium]
MKKSFVLLFLLFATKAFNQTTQQKISNYIADQQHAMLKEYAEFISIPNVLGDSLNIYRNADYIKNLLGKLGVKTQLLTLDKPGAAPVVFGEVITPGATKTIAFYAHYDGQPVNPKQWAAGLEPFKPALLTDRIDKGGQFISFPNDNEPINPDWRLYGRGSSDDKAGVYAIIKAYEAIIKNNFTPGINIKFFFEGEEEAGSVNLGDIMDKYKAELKADCWVICDGPRHQSGRKQIAFGVRGDVNVDLIVYGGKRPLHSGNYGNWAPNPAMRLAQLLASMKDKNGMVTIKGFYDDVTPLSASEKEAIKKVPAIEGILKDELGIAVPDGGGKSFLELINLPTLNINGMQSMNVGAMASNIIPSTATAVLDLRLVLGNDVDRQVNKLINHIKSQGYYVTDKAPTDEERKKYGWIAQVNKRGTGYNAQRTPMDMPIAKNIITAVQTTTKDPVVLLPGIGGSLPLYLFEKKLGTKPITMNLVNYDNNQHAENENIRLGYLWQGIETVAATMLIK